MTDSHRVERGVPAFAGDERWDWVEQTERGVGIVAVILPNMPGNGLMPLTCRTRKLAERFRPYAKMHAEASGNRVWLRRWTVYEDLEEA